MEIRPWGTSGQIDKITTRLPTKSQHCPPHVARTAAAALVPGGGDVVGQFEDAALAQQPGPQLDADDAEYEEDEEAEQQNVAEHRQRVEQQHHQYAQICQHQQPQLGSAIARSRKKQEAFEKCWAHSVLRTAVTLPVTRCRYCRTPAIAIAQAACDVHDIDDDNDDDNDNGNA